MIKVPLHLLHNTFAGLRQGKHLIQTFPLSARPITLSDDMEVELSVESRSHNFLVAIDGRNESCTEGTRLSVRKAPYQVHVLKRSRGSYFRTLRTKLMWGTDVRSEL